MRVIDLPEGEEHAYFNCLEEWSGEMAESGDRKERWYRRMVDRGLRVKVAVAEDGVIGGMIQYGPIENVALQGEGLQYMYCIWVHGYENGRGNRQKQGMGRALLEAAEADSRDRGAKGFVVWGLLLPFFMRAAWFRKHGYRPVDRNGMMQLLWKPFFDDARPPRFLKQQSPIPRETRKVTVTCFNSGWCPAQNIIYERAQRAAAEFGEEAVFRLVDTFEREDAARWGITDALYVDGKLIGLGPPPSYEKIRAAIRRRVKRL